MINNKVAIIFLVIILIYFLFMKPNAYYSEGFVPIDSRRHAKLNEYGGVDYVSDRPPCWRGEYGCNAIPCPSTFEEDIICWDCRTAIDMPQLV